MVPIFTWNPASAFTMLRLFGSEELGGLGDVSAKASILAKATGRTIEEIAHEVTILFRLSHIMKISNQARVVVSSCKRRAGYGAWTTDSIRL